MSLALLGLPLAAIAYLLIGAAREAARLRRRRRHNDLVLELHARERARVDEIRVIGGGTGGLYEKGVR